jgi:hypothetical protein
MPTLSATRAVLALRGLKANDLPGLELTPHAVHAFRALRGSHSRDLARPIEVRELPDNRGFV